MARTRKCPNCGAVVVKTRDTCPHCQSSMAAAPRWDDPSQSRAKREGKLRAANIRMRNSGAVLFGVGILLMTQGERIGKLVIIGVISIVIGTILFLWGWKLLQVGK
jgi:uncharacterized OB-fold protein